MRILPALAFLISLCTAQFHPTQVVGETLLHQGVERSFMLVGDDQSTSPKPLIVHLHGFRKPEAIAASPNLDVIRWNHFEGLAAQQGFLVAAPSALKGRWNMGVDLPNIELRNGTKVDDVGFVLKLVDQLVLKGLVDPARVYITGISDGAIMTNRILCTADHTFRAGASLIGTMYEIHAKACRKAKPIAMFILAGTHDNVLPYDGLLFSSGRSLSAPEITELWRVMHRCTGQTRKQLPDLVKRDYTVVTQKDWTGCNSATAVRLLRVAGGGHTLPSTQKRQLFKRGWTGRNQDIDTATKVLEFFQDVEAN